MAHHRTISFFRFSGIGLQRTAYSLSCGVTLIELLVVMVIMAMLMSVSVPAFISMGRGSDMRGAVSNVRNTIAQSRQWTITHREPVTFCCIPKQSPTNPACYYVTNSAGLYLQASNTLPLSVDFSLQASITFKTDGSLAGDITQPAKIVIVSGNVQKEIEVNTLTGGIRVQ